jgi:hypothetical protein
MPSTPTIGTRETLDPRRAPASLQDCERVASLYADAKLGALLWLLGVPLPIIILLALFWHH